MWSGGVNGQRVCPWEARGILGSLCRCRHGCAAGCPSNYSPKNKEVHFSSLSQLFCTYPAFAYCQPSHLFLQQFPFIRVLWCWKHDSTFCTWGSMNILKPHFLHEFSNTQKMCPVGKALQPQMNGCSECAWDKNHIYLSCFYASAFGGHEEMGYWAK